MRHFSAEKWSDFVRGVTPPRERDGMQAHLESGCRQCRAEVAWLEQVKEAAALETTEDPPVELVASAHAIFRAPESKDWMDRLEQIAAELIFDSRNDLQPAGIRSVETARVRLEYRAGEYSVDLQIEPMEASLDIVGQITGEGGRTGDLDGAVVQIVSGGHTLAET